VFWVALLRLLIAAGGQVVAVGAGRGQRRVVLAGRSTDQDGWTLVFPASGQRQPIAAVREDVASARSRSEPALSPGPVAGVLIGYARCSTDKQDLAAQRHSLRQLGVSDDRVYLDHGMTCRNRRRPGLQQALGAVRQGDTLVVPKCSGSEVSRRIRGQATWAAGWSSRSATRSRSARVNFHSNGWAICS
jgi:Resolvase, N terminal domain